MTVLQLERLHGLSEVVGEGRVIPSWISPPPEAVNVDCTVWNAIRFLQSSRKPKRYQPPERCDLYLLCSIAESGFNAAS
jgi:hypothetical protein